MNDSRNSLQTKYQLQLSVTEGTPRESLPQGYVLCGGKSSRFGQDKARFVLDGEPLIIRNSNQLTAWNNLPCIAVADQAGKYEDLGITTLADQIPDSGPLAGLQTALSHQQNLNELNSTHSDWIILISCDHTWIDQEWMNLLWQTAQANKQAAAVIFDESASLESATSGRAHPFPGCYHISLLSSIEQQLGASMRSFQKFLATQESKVIRLPIPSNWPEVPQLNRPEDLEKWQALRNSPQQQIETGKHSQPE